MQEFLQKSISLTDKFLPLLFSFLFFVKLVVNSNRVVTLHGANLTTNKGNAMVDFL